MQISLGFCYSYVSDPFSSELAKISYVTRKIHTVKHLISVASKSGNLGPVVQSVVSLTSSLRVILLTVLADSMHNILIFFAEKM